jgi:branched-subunit amino acid ABC-type transport system permease component
MSTFVDAIVLGLFQAAPLSLAAVGFTLIFYLSRFINVAYGENLTLGAYTAIFLNTTLGLNFYLAIVPAALLTGVISVLTFLLVFGPAHRGGVGPTEMIVLSVGLAFLIRHALRLGFGLENHLFEVGRPAYLTILGIGITSVQLMALCLVVLIATALYFFIFKTTYEQMIRGAREQRGPRAGQRHQSHEGVRPDLVHRGGRRRARGGVLRPCSRSSAPSLVGT